MKAEFKMNLKETKNLILYKLELAVSQREKTRGTGVFLAENIDSYYMQVGEIFCLQSLCESLGIKTNLINYNPYERDQDDDKFNYCMGLGKIGKKE